MSQVFSGFLGVALIILVALALSTARRRIRLRVVGAAFALQAVLAFIVLRTPWGVNGIHAMAGGVSALLSFASEGTAFLFGKDNPLGNSFALGALPVIVFFAALVSILYHVGVMQRVVQWVGGAIGAITGISRVESLSAAANIFVGQSESPLVVRPYLANLRPTQIFTLMTVGMAGVAGTILAAYAGLLGPDYLPYLLAAAFMSAPGGILMAKIIMPDDEDLSSAPEEAVAVSESFDEGHAPANIIEAAAIGAQTGLKLAAAVGAMVLVFVALVAMANGFLAAFGGFFGWNDLSFQQILGYAFAPIMYVLGINDWAQAHLAGGLFGTKIVLNEFVAFIELGAIDGSVLTERSRAIVTFALCGFANFSSIAIQMAVTGSLAPNQRPVIARLGLRALAAGSLANLMSAALAGLFLPM